MAGIAANLGHSVAVAGIASEETPKVWQDIPLISLSGQQRLGPVTLASGYRDLVEQAVDYDLIHVHLPHPVAEWYLTRGFRRYPRLGARLVPVIHADIYRWRPAARIWQWAITQQVLRECHAVMAATRELLKCSPVYRNTLPKAVMIPFPVPPFFHRGDMVQGQEGLQMLAVGRLVSYKGFDVLLRALANLSETPAWHLHIVGTGPLMRDLQKKINQWGLSKRVTMTGEIDEDRKALLMGAADLVVVPSTTSQEAFGMIIAEAFAAGKPVVTTALPTGVSFLARGGQCGAVVPPRDHYALTVALRDLLTNEVKRVGCGRRNLDFWRQHLTLEGYASAYGHYLESWGREILPVTLQPAV